MNKVQLAFMFYVVLTVLPIVELTVLESETASHHLCTYCNLKYFCCSELSCQQYGR